jgi:hypothetical protein
MDREMIRMRPFWRVTLNGPLPHRRNKSPDSDRLPAGIEGDVGATGAQAVWRSALSIV